MVPQCLIKSGAWAAVSRFILSPHTILKVSSLIMTSLSLAGTSFKALFAFLPFFPSLKSPFFSFSFLFPTFTFLGLGAPLSGFFFFNCSLLLLLFLFLNA